MYAYIPLVFIYKPSNQNTIQYIHTINVSIIYSMYEFHLFAKVLIIFQTGNECVITWGTLFSYAYSNEQGV